MTAIPFFASEHDKEFDVFLTVHHRIDVSKYQLSAQFF